MEYRIEYTIEMDAPFHEIIDHLFVGNANARESRKFDLVVNCTREGEIPFPTDYAPLCIRIPIRDDPSESAKLLGILQETDVLEQIDSYRKNQRSVLIHCSMGMQRSCAVTACYLIRYFRKTPEESIAMIKSKRPVAFFGACNLLDAIETFYQSERRCV